VIASRIYIVHQSTHLLSPSDTIDLFDRTFFILAFATAVLFSCLSIWMGYKLIFPLGRIIVKARAISRKDYSLLSDSAEASAEYLETGEWSDLESTLNRIEKNLQTQDIRLSMEQEEVSAIISGISEAVIAVNREGDLLFFNSQFAVLFGDQEEIKKSTRRLATFFRNPDVLDVFRSTLQDGVARTVNTQIQLKNEAVPRYFSLSVAPLKLPQKDAYGAVGVFHDVSELKRMDQVRIDFVANVSHELRTPLTSIRGFAETLEADLKQNNIEAAPKYLSIISRNVDRLIALVGDLLDLSSLESGGELEKTEINLKELTEKVLQQLEPLAKTKSHEIRLRFETETLFADAKRIEQVLFNLTENAIKYVPAGKTIELRWHADENRTCYLHVSDDGPGIPVEHHARLFERFYRVDAGRGRDQGGTGLGLAIVKHIVQGHGGNVRVHGGLGRGTEFICCFPFMKER
jgi:two-component system phosphate regulon sensor histidine kinase PhoR